MSDFKKGLELGKLVRELSTELRTKGVDPLDFDQRDSPYYERSQDLKTRTESLGLSGYVGLMFGHLLHYREWSENADYLFGHRE